MRASAIAVRMLALLVVVVPKGFIGTWETRGDYRELIIIETETMNREHGSRA